MAAAVLLPTGLTVLLAEGLLLAEADGGELAGRDAQRNEILLHSRSTAVAQAEVVFRRATLVAVALNSRFHRRMTFEELRCRGERLASVGADVRFVGVKVRVLNF